MSCRRKAVALSKNMVVLKEEPGGAHFAHQWGYHKILLIYCKYIGKP